MIDLRLRSQTTLQQALEAMVPDFADYAFVHLARKEGDMREVAVLHRDPDHEGRLKRVLRMLRSRILAPRSLIGRVMASGEPERIEGRAARRAVEQVAVDEETLGELRELIPRAYLVLPLETARGVIGTLSVARVATNTPFTDREVGLLGVIAGLAAGALHDANRLQRDASAGENEPPTVLLLESQPGERAEAARILRQAGFQVLEAGDASSGVRRWRQAGGEVHALIADLDSGLGTGSSGERSVPDQLRLIRPNLPVLYSSRKPGLQNVFPGLLEDRIRFVEKPFAEARLVEKLRDLFPDHFQPEDDGRTLDGARPRLSHRRVPRPLKPGSDRPVTEGRRGEKARAKRKSYAILNEGTPRHLIQPGHSPTSCLRTNSSSNWSIRP